MTKNPFFRLFFISVNVLLWSALILMGLRQLGYQQSFTQYNHPLLQQDKLYLYKSNSYPAKAEDAEIISKNLNWVPLIDIEFIDQAWHLIQETHQRPYRSKAILSLKKYLKNLGSNSLAINIRNRSLTRFSELTELLAAHKNLNIIFTSETTHLLREARKKQPSWLFMSSHTLLSRLLVMGSLFLETMTSIDEDLIPVDDPTDLSPRIINEIQRRKKFLILNVGPAQEVNTSGYKNFYGFISPDFKSLKKISAHFK